MITLAELADTAVRLHPGIATAASLLREEHGNTLPARAYIDAVKEARARLAAAQRDAAEAPDNLPELAVQALREQPYHLKRGYVPALILIKRADVASGHCVRSVIEYMCALRTAHMRQMAVEVLAECIADGMGEGAQRVAQGRLSRRAPSGTTTTDIREAVEYAASLNG